MCWSWAEANDWPLPTHWEITALVYILLRVDFSQFGTLGTQENKTKQKKQTKKKTQTTTMKSQKPPPPKNNQANKTNEPTNQKQNTRQRDRVGHWKQSLLQQVAFRPVSFQTTSLFLKGMEMIVFPTQQYFSSSHGCPLLLLIFSSLPSTFCSKSFPSFWCCGSLQSSSILYCGCNALCDN